MATTDEEIEKLKTQAAAYVKTRTEPHQEVLEKIRENMEKAKK